jgi:NDP-sugar pyrophosphorylase family protein
MSAKFPLFYPDWRAMILAAGFGTRLKPLTEQVPKPLVKVAGVPMLKLTLNRLRELKPGTLVVNGHHLSGQIKDFLQERNSGFRRLEYVFEPAILDTGGGILNAARFLDGPFFVTLNADIVTDISLFQAVSQHLQSRALVTMVLHERPRYNQVEVDAEGRIRGFGGGLTGSANRLLAYTGIQICSPLLLALMAREKVPAFSLITFYKRLLGAGRLDIRAHIVDTENHFYWRDLGTHDDLAAVANDLRQDKTLARRLGFDAQDFTGL